MSILRGNFSPTISIPTITDLNQKWKVSLNANLNRKLTEKEEFDRKPNRNLDGNANRHQYLTDSSETCLCATRHWTNR
jgi:hypothetical protein